jgi:uncharacterized RDD family membrane protein YckC
MDWYFVEGGDRKGPINDVEFDGLVRSGRVKADTIVWHEGLGDWQSYGAVSTSAVATADGTARCVECGQTFPTTEMLQYEGSWVCATCKPVFFQKVREGIVPARGFVYGGFWVRFVAKFIDGILLQVVNFIVRIPLLFMTDSAHPSLTFTFITIGISMVIAAAYGIFFVGKYGATPGKMALRLRIVRADGGDVGYGLATGRHFAELLSSLTLLIGYIIAAFDDQKRTLHDRICDTRVIRTNA